MYKMPNPNIVEIFSGQDCSCAVMQLRFRLVGCSNPSDEVILELNCIREVAKHLVHPIVGLWLTIFS
jgi:hypothetical protein